jgi:hypothetical protein
MRMSLLALNSPRATAPSAPLGPSKQQARIAQAAALILALAARQTPRVVVESPALKAIEEDSVHLRQRGLKDILLQEIKKSLPKRLRYTECSARSELETALNKKFT